MPFKIFFPPPNFESKIRLSQVFNNIITLIFKYNIFQVSD